MKDLKSGAAGPDDSQNANGNVDGGVESSSSGSPSDKKSSKRNDYTTKITVSIEDDVVQRLRSAVYFTPGLTMYKVVQKGVQVVLDDLQEDIGEFPQKEGGLSGGPDPEAATLGLGFNVDQLLDEI